MYEDVLPVFDINYKSSIGVLDKTVAGYLKFAPNLEFTAFEAPEPYPVYLSVKVFPDVLRELLEKPVEAKNTTPYGGNAGSITKPEAPIAAPPEAS
jgi:hypothetical protein